MKLQFFTKKSWLLIVGLLLIIGCQESTNDLTQVEMNSIIEQKTAELTKVLLSGKLDSIMNYYDKDASLSPDGFPLIQGRENIRSFLTKGMKMAKFSKLEFETDYINGNKEFIYQMGLMKSKIVVYDSLNFDNSAKFFYLWKLQNDGTYKIAAEVNNTKDEDDD